MIPIPKAVLKKKKNSAKNIWAFAISVTERKFAALFCNSVFFLKTVVPFRHSLFLIFRRKKKEKRNQKGLGSIAQKTNPGRNGERSLAR